MKFLRGLLKFLPTFFTALILAIVVWVSAVTASDPTEDNVYPQDVPLTILGLDSDQTILNDYTKGVKLTIRAPRSIQNQLLSQPDLIKATLNLAGLEPGSHEVVPQITMNVRPASVINISPETISITLDSLISNDLAISVVQTGSLPISFEAGEVELSTSNVTVFGARSLVTEIEKVVATVDLTNVTSSIFKSVTLEPYDMNGNLVKNVRLTPSSVQMRIPITQLGGYRNVFVKITTTGQIASGFYLTNLYASPPNVTIYTSDPVLANNMPAFVETMPINLNGADENFEIDIPLNLPDGIILIGEPTIKVEVGIAAIESSKNYLNLPIQILNLSPRYKVTLNPQSVDLYLSGPLHILDSLSYLDIIVSLDLSGYGPGTYSLAPEISIAFDSIQTDAIIPGTIEVVITD